MFIMFMFTMYIKDVLNRIQYAALTIGQMGTMVSLEVQDEHSSTIVQDLDTSGYHIKVFHGKWISLVFW